MIGWSDVSLWIVSELHWIKVFKTFFNSQIGDWSPIGADTTKKCMPISITLSVYRQVSDSIYIYINNYRDYVQ